MIESTGAYPVGSGWHAVVLTLDRDVVGTTDRLSLYVDDVLQASLEELLPNIFFNNGNVLMDASNFFSNPAGDLRRNFDGVIDSVLLTDLPYEPQSVPVPPPLALLFAGMIGCATFRRRRSKKSA